MVIRILNKIRKYVQEMNGARVLCHGNVFCNYNLLKIHTFPQAKPSAVIQLTFMDIYRKNKKERKKKSL